jgi:pimeloyl-ACP methyl ester carboxylesterase
MYTIDFYGTGGPVSFAYQDDYYEDNSGGLTVEIVGTEPPAAPSGLHATEVRASKVTLAWADNSGDEQGFIIEQAGDGQDFHPVGSVATDTTAFTATVLRPSTDYQFRVAAYNEVGQSDYSNVIDVTTSDVDQGTMPPNDDSYSERLYFGFEINFYGKTYDQLYVNNNGNITLDNQLGTYSPYEDLKTAYGPIIAPFFADVDTRDDGVGTVSFGPLTTPDGFRSYKVSWDQVGYYNENYDKRNTFSVTLVDRRDSNLGDFDIEFDYGGIQWDTGDASGGVNGFVDPEYPDDAAPARIGWSNGSGTEGMYAELPGSGEPNTFIGAGPGHQHWEIRNPDMDIDGDNNAGDDWEPDHSTDEEALEDDLTEPGRVIGVDNGDLNAPGETTGDGIPDYADGFPVEGLADNAAPGDLQFMPLTIRLPEPFDPTMAQFRFEYSGSDPGQVQVGGDSTEPVITPAPGNLRIWTEDGSTERQLSDYVAPYLTYTADELGLTSNRMVTLFVEAVAHSPAAGAERIKMFVDVLGNGNFFLADEVGGTAVEPVLIDAQAFGPHRDGDGYDFYADFGTNVPDSSHVVGAAADGSSLLVLGMLPQIEPAKLLAKYVLVDEDGTTNATDPYKVGALFAPDARPSMPAPDKSDNVQAQQSLEQAITTADGFALYRPPNNFLLKNHNPTDEYGKIYIKTVDTRTGGELYKRDLILRRPPLLLVHGFLGDPGSFPDNGMDFDGNVTVKWQTEDPKAPVYTIVKKVDYSGSNSKGFAENFGVVPLAIGNWLAAIRSGDYGSEPKSKEQILNQRFAVTRVDVVAHSMGGLLVKWFAADFGRYLSQNPAGETVSRDPGGAPNTLYPAFHLGRDPSNDYLRDNNFGGGDIHRLVTLGTPFQGSPVAIDVFGKLEPTQPNITALRNLTDDVGIGGKVTSVFFGGNKTGPYVAPTAVADLRSVAGTTKSAALTQLNTNAAFPQGTKAVKWHAVGGLVSETITDNTTLKEDLVWDILMGVLQAKLGVNIQLPPDSDLIVPVSSSRDGLAKTYLQGAFFTQADDTAHVPAKIIKRLGYTNSSTVSAAIRVLLSDDPAANVFIPLDKQNY